VRAFDLKVRILSEELARTLGRRKFLKQAGATMFAGIAALAAGHTLNGTSAANGITPGKQPMIPECSPPGPYCNLNGVNEPNGCHGGSCFQHLYQGQVIQCRLWYCCYQAGCWTTPSGKGYWTCCDCECFNSAGQSVATCGCAQYSTQPVPRPDGPGGSTNS
jgi:hypothetical protein